MKRIIAPLAALFMSAGVAFAGGSTINTAIPAQGSPLSSAPIRQNFTAAATDINNLLSMFAGTTQPLSPVTFSMWAQTGVNPSPISIFDGTQYVTTGFLDKVAHTYSPVLSSSSLAVNAPLTSSFVGGVYTISLSNDSSLAVSGGNLGINPAHSNTFTAAQGVNLNTAPLATAQTGTALQIAQANGVTTRIELDSYAAVPRFTCARADGTAASPTTLQAADEICSLNAFGYNGSATVGPQAAIRTYASQNWTTGALGTYLRFAVTPNSGTTLTDALGIEQDGSLTTGAALGTGVGAGNLNLGGGSLYNNGVAPTGTGAYVRGTSPTIASPAFSGTVTGAGTIPNAVLVNSKTTVNGVDCVLGSNCSITATAASITVGTTTIVTGTPTRILYDNAGTLGEYTITGSGTAVVMATAPSIASPTFTGTVGGAGTIPNGVLANSSITINGSSVSLGGSTTVTAVASAITVGTTLVNSGSNLFILYNNAGTLGNLSTSGTGNVVLVTGPTINNLTGTGSTALAATAITSASASAFTVGLNGATNPALQVDASTASQAAGLKVTGAATGGTVAIAAIDSGSNTNLTLNAKGTGTIGIGSVSTGAVTITPALTLSATLTYGGVTLNNAVTGTGNMVLSASPTITGTMTGGNANFGGTLSSGADTIFSGLTTALTVGLNGATNPAFQVDASAALQAAGIKITGAATGGTVAIAAIDSGSNTSLTINAKGTGTIAIGSISTGVVGIIPKLNLGSTGAIVGQLQVFNLTSGSILLQPATGALGSAVLTLPDITDTLAGFALANGGTNNALTASNGGIVYSDASKLQILAGTSTAGLCLLSANLSAPTWGSCSGAAAVSSVSGTAGQITVSPTTGSVVVSLPATITQAETFSGGVTFSTATTTFSSTANFSSTFQIGGNAMTFPGSAATLAALTVADQTITGGANVTSLSLSTGSITVDCGSRPLQYITNNGAYTITAPASDGSCMLKVTNGASAGATTFSGFTVGSNTGDALTTTNTNIFYITFVRINGTSTYLIKAAQ